MLLNYRGWRDTLACVESLLVSTRGFCRLVICDNASPDDSWLRLQEGLTALLGQHAHTLAHWWPAAAGGLLQCGTQAQLSAGWRPDAPVVLVDNQSNGGFAAGNNVGLRLLLQDPAVTWFWLLNNDTEVAADALAQLVRCARQRPEVGLWGATVLYHHKPHEVQALAGGAMRRWSAETWHLGAFESWQPPSPARVQAIEARMDYVLGASMFASRAWLEDVGLLDERYFLYCEELDWAMRGRGRHALGWAASAVIHHKEGASIGTDPDGGSPLSVFHLMRSRMIFARLRLPAWRRAVVAVAGLRTVARFLAKRRWALARSALSGARAGWSAPLQDTAGALR
ncbi:MAG: glycosyltransferase family 2 protein [Burkholderiales bacterium]|nr:glycosyltransferase family 2 protein [Burkholderiales bacterium]MCH2240792.1 glycosyltransferase family 2 protein [Aquabacterium sp.]